MEEEENKVMKAIKWVSMGRGDEGKWGTNGENEGGKGRCKRASKMRKLKVG